MAAYFKHASAIVDEPSAIGAGARIWHFSHVMPGARIGDGSSIGQNCYIGSRAVIGTGVKIQNNVSVYDDVVLEDDVFCGPSVVFTNVFNPRSFVNRKDEYRPTLIRQGATLGANSTIVCGVTIGRYALVGAGCVITKDIPDFALVYGVPAGFKGWVCKCGEKLPGQEGALTCTACGLQYEAAAGTCTIKE